MITQQPAKSLPVLQGPVTYKKFHIYDKVRVKEGAKLLPVSIKPGDVGLVDGVTFMPMGVVHVSFDGGEPHGFSIMCEYLEKINER